MMDERNIDAVRTASHYWVPQAWIDGAVRHDVRFTVTGDGRFAGVRSDATSRDGDTVLDGLMLPGIADCHSHTFHRALRGLGHEGATFWQWRDTMYRVAANLTPENYYEYAKAVYAEMLLAGYTTVAEFHYVHHRPDGTPYDDPNAMGEALIRAARDAGIRLTLLDTCYLYAGVDGSPLSDRQRRFGDGTVDAFLERLDDLANRDHPDTVRVGAAVHSVRACAWTDAQAIAAWSHDSHDALHPRPVHVHLSEQTAENQSCVDEHGVSPTSLLSQARLWDSNATAVHATHLSEGDIALLGAAHAHAAICPTTEADLADGIPAAAAMRDAGVRLCIGSDENVSIDPFEEIRRLDGNQRLVSGMRDTFTPAELVAMLTTNGQDACGWPESGRIEDGAFADAVLLDTSSPHLAGVTPESVSLTATAGDVRDVMVGGRFVVRDCVPLGAESAEAVAATIRDLTGTLRRG